MILLPQMNEAIINFFIKVPSAPHVGRYSKSRRMIKYYYIYTPFLATDG